MAKFPVLKPHILPFFPGMVALAFIWLSLTPSLLPRPAIFQGLTSAVAALLGYGIGALVVAATLALGVGQLSTRGLAAPWNPTIVILPVTAGLVCVAVVAIRGRTWPAVAGILLGTLVVFTFDPCLGVENSTTDWLIEMCSAR